MALAFSMVGLAIAMRSLPWHQLRDMGGHRRGAHRRLTAMITGAESASVIKVVLMLGVVGCIVGLKAVSH